MRARLTDAQPEVLLFLERNEEIPATVSDFFLEKGITNALIDGSGRATWVTLEGGPSGSRRVGGPLELIHIHGSVEPKGKGLQWDLRVVASRELDTGVEVVAGVLRDAQIERAILRITQHRSTTPTAVSALSGWSAVAAASAEAGPPSEAGSETPVVGDVVRHPKFGECKVKGIDDDHIRIRLDGGRTISLGLSRLSFDLSGELSSGKRVFAVHIKKKR